MSREKAFFDPVAQLPHDVRMPLLGFGTFPMRGAEAREAVGHALRLGYRLVDTARRYRNEDAVGTALKDSKLPRGEVFVTTKMPPDQVGHERATLEGSLQALGLEHVDLWLMHWPPGGYAGVDSWREFIKARDEGLVRAIGVSNYSLKQVDTLIAETGVAPAVCQLAWSPTLFDAKLMAGFKERKVVMSAHSPFRQSNLDDPVIEAIATRHGKTANQVIVRWNLQHGVAVVPKSSVPERMAGNADVFDFELSAAEMNELDRSSVAQAR